MKKMAIGLMGLMTMTLLVPETMAAPRGHHGGRHHGNDGLRLAAGIVHLVREVVAPRQVVYTQPAPVVVTPAPVPAVYTPPAPVVITPAPRPVVVNPAPVVYAPPRVVVTPPRHHRRHEPPRHHRPAPPRGGHHR